MKQGPEEGSRESFVPTHHTVRVTILDHHGGEVGGLDHHGGGVRHRPSPGFFDAAVALAEEVEVVGLGGVNHPNEFEADADFGSHRADGGAVPQQNGGDGLGLDQSGGHPDNARIESRREHNALGVAAQDFHHGPEEGIRGVKNRGSGAGHSLPSGCRGRGLR